MKYLLILLTLCWPISLIRCGTEAGNPGDDDRPYRDAKGIMRIDLRAVIDSGVNTVVAAADTSTAMLAGGGLALTTSSDPYCTSFGAPIAANATDNTEESSGAKYMSDQHQNYAAGYFYCLLRQDTNSNESVPGALLRAKIWPCVIGSDLRFDNQQRSVTINNIDSLGTCIGEQRLSGLMEKGIQKVETSYQASEIKDGVHSGWDGLVTFENRFDGNLFSNEQVLVKKSDFIEAYAVITTNQENRSEGFIFYFNRALKNAYYELWVPDRGTETGSSTPNSYHIRALIEGDVTDKKFTNLSRYRAIRANSYFPNNLHNSNYLSIDGGTDSGFRVTQYYCSATSGCSDLTDATAWRKIHRDNNCYGGGSCSAGFAFDADALEFFLDNTIKPGVASAQDWFSSLALPTGDTNFSPTR